MKIKRCEMAEKIEVSRAHMSDVLNGHTLVGRRVAKNIEKVIGEPWNVIMAMKPEEIERKMTEKLWKEFIVNCFYQGYCVEQEKKN